MNAYSHARTYVTPLWKYGATPAIVSPTLPLADSELCGAAVRGKCIWDRWMKCNYQSWRSQHDGIPLSAPALHLAILRYSLTPSRSSSTLAHNLYYGRGAHIINLIKRSALKIVLLVRQLLTAVTFLSPSFPATFVLSLSFSYSPPSSRPLYSYRLFSQLLFALLVACLLFSCLPSLLCVARAEIF